MTGHTNKHLPWSWHRHVWLAALLAIAVHTISVYWIPRVIMNRVINTVAGEGSQPYLPPPIDHTHRRVVMPSPDLLYAVCAYDLADGPLSIKLDGSYARYWSIALYNSRSDNFLTLSGDTLGASGVDLTIDEKKSTRKGLLLMRVLTGSDRHWLEVADRFRSRLRCSS